MNKLSQTTQLTRDEVKIWFEAILLWVQDAPEQEISPGCQQKEILKPSVPAEVPRISYLASNL